LFFGNDRYAERKRKEKMMQKPIKRSKLMAEINITPFTDVVLVLLVIFMITTPLLLQPGIKLRLPNVKTAETETGKSINIMIDASGDIFLNEKKTELAEIKSTVSTRLISDPDMPVIVKADKEVKYDAVIQVIDAAKQAGAKRFALAVELGLKQEK
jgi:biopolymer transport protein ExbD